MPSRFLRGALAAAVLLCGAAVARAAIFEPLFMVTKVVGEVRIEKPNGTTDVVRKDHAYPYGSRLLVPTEVSEEEAEMEQARVSLAEVVRGALAGELHVSRRATLAVTADFERADGSAYTLESFALNDLAISRGGQGAVIEFDISVSGHHIDRLRGDGFIVSTATGSTGYALAAGGPIVTPEFTGMVCVPVAPHTIMARAFLTSPSDVVEISMSPDRPVKRHFFADGQPLGEENGNEGFEGMRVMVRRGPGDILLLDHSAQSFYQSVSRVFYGKTGGK